MCKNVTVEKMQIKGDILVKEPLSAQFTHHVILETQGVPHEPVAHLGVLTQPAWRVEIHTPVFSVTQINGYFHL